MSSKIVEWLVGDWDGKTADYRKNLNIKKKSELYLKRRNPVFLPKALILLATEGVFRRVCDCSLPSRLFKNL